MGIFLGLLVGKPLGISLASFIAVKLKAGEMPARASWKMLIAVACLGGIGFTMSIFVDTLSFGDQAPEIMAKLRDMGKVAVLMGSLCAGLLGSLLITIVNKFEKN
jgi:NhaA family Na+:H+ antiporter